MIRWMEANGYEVTHTTDVDSNRPGSLIKNHKVFLSVGHDEYWSGPQEANVTTALIFPIKSPLVLSNLNPSLIN